MIHGGSKRKKRCQGITKKGKRCKKNVAIGKQKYCSIHSSKSPANQKLRSFPPKKKNLYYKQSFVPSKWSPYPLGEWD